MELDGKNVLVTGGTGSFGKEFVKLVLQSHNSRKVIVFDSGRWLRDSAPVPSVVGLL